MTTNIRPILDKAVAGERISPREAYALLTSPDWTSIVAAGHQRRLRMHDPGTGQLHRLPGHQLHQLLRRGLLLLLLQGRDRKRSGLYPFHGADRRQDGRSPGLGRGYRVHPGRRESQAPPVLLRGRLAHAVGHVQSPRARIFSGGIAAPGAQGGHAPSRSVGHPQGSGAGLGSRRRRGGPHRSHAPDPVAQETERRGLVPGHGRMP